jgi:hypothetical protein
VVGKIKKDIGVKELVQLIEETSTSVRKQYQKDIDDEILVTSCTSLMTFMVGDKSNQLSVWAINNRFPVLSLMLVNAGIDHKEVF